MSYYPRGVTFYDRAERRTMMLVNKGSFAGWICYQHADGQWVTLRRATTEDRAHIAAAARPEGPPEPE